MPALQSLDSLSNWFASKNWTPWPFQEEAWRLALEGKSMLISVPTGAGKTYAAYLGPLAAIHEEGQEGLQLLYLTPLRSLARDIEIALKLPVSDLGWNVAIESRTGDTRTSQKIKQKKKSPHVLLTTPESLSILQSDPEHRQFFSKLKYVIVDEWHELCGTKRGALLELSLAHLRSFLPHLCTLVMSATLANLAEAAQAAVGRNVHSTLVQATLDRPVIVESLLPSSIYRFPWAGFLGIQMLPLLLEKLDPAIPTMIFTNTRSQAEKWFQGICDAKPEWKPRIALHHSSIDQVERHRAEDGIKQGNLSFIVCTSSLDLGVDFPSVERVVQIGSCKSIARLIQRAGRASHAPMKPCHITLVPSHAMEVVEILALRKALADKSLESRAPLKMCYDVLFQHLTTLAVGGGFNEEEAYKEVSSTYGFAAMERSRLNEVIDHLHKGGNSLQAYPDYQKLIYDGYLYKIKDRAQAIRHRMSIGTIASDTSVQLQQLRGKKIGQVEEQFVAKLQKGDAFSFGGKIYELVHLADLTATVRLSRKKEVVTPVWLGSKLPLSPSLSAYVLKAIDSFATSGALEYPESPLFNEICEIQNHFSQIPRIDQFLIETVKTRDGWYYFFYPFEGRLVHDALAALVAYRLSKFHAGGFLLSTTDYGFALLSHKKVALDETLVRQILSMEGLDEDLKESSNLKELAKMRFRDIAKIGGLLFQGYPTRRKTYRQIQMSSSILFDVFFKYEPTHLLLKQAFEEVFRESIQFERLKQLLGRLSGSELMIQECSRMTPLALPLFATAMWGKLSPQEIAERLKEMTAKW
ncbi:MAG: ligase-associated DNA damage response DEXH box helicase [Parachlamydia sp.]|nr:ligase-associated DNA damage response DEXH box helicase [Parachlamydia sp.]